MKILTFSGATPAEALKKAQLEVGEDAMLIETKELRKKALGKPALYEIVVGIEEDAMPPKRTSPEYPQTKPLHEQRPLTEESSDVLFNISSAAQQISKIAEVTDVAEQTPQSKSEPAELKEIKDAIATLGDKVKLIQNMFWDEKAPDMQAAIPAEFAEIYKLSLESGMNKSHLDAIMQMTIEHMPFKMRENTQTVKRYFQVLLRKMIPVRLETPPTPTQKKVIMLVGPTGVGKTTSIAKLAARYSFLMEKKHKVGLIVLDTYRIGAVEQLMQYARMMKLGIETVVDPPEFAHALESMRYCDYILIDTMGSSPYDQEKIETISQCLTANTTSYNFEVVLVMPSSIKYEDLKATHDNFAKLNVDTMMFTKLDETRGFGNIFSLAYETRKPISYFSIGQEVPEDLVVANSDFLIDCLLNGFDRSKIK
ncbi:MAG TPA: flagellar biosynthesis protein FlhF [Helicobacteraceae bacterium]|nr:flagellar biosynthesis protein FlhF [Helicobacteraceae bacterium]